MYAQFVTHIVFYNIYNNYKQLRKPMSTHLKSYATIGTTHTHMYMYIYDTHIGVQLYKLYKHTHDFPKYAALCKTYKHIQTYTHRQHLHTRTQHIFKTLHNHPNSHNTYIFI